MIYLGPLCLRYSKSWAIKGVAEISVTSLFGVCSHINLGRHISSYWKLKLLHLRHAGSYRLLQ